MFASYFSSIFKVSTSDSPTYTQHTNKALLTWHISVLDIENWIYVSKPRCLKRSRSWWCPSFWNKEYCFSILVPALWISYNCFFCWNLSFVSQDWLHCYFENFTNVFYRSLKIGYEMKFMSRDKTFSLLFFRLFSYSGQTKSNLTPINKVM